MFILGFNPCIVITSVILKVSEIIGPFGHMVSNHLIGGRIDFVGVDVRLAVAVAGLV